MSNIFKNKHFSRLFSNVQRNTIMKKTLQRLSREQNQFGRSMLEMIAVLVIIGLLSSAGVVGYKSAHDTYRASSIMDTVMKGKLAVEADYKVAGETTLVRALENGPIANPSDNVSVSYNVSCYDERKCKEFVITTTESAGVCEKIVSRQSLYNSSDDEEAKTGIYISPDNVDSCGEEGDVLMTFSFKIPIREQNDGTDRYSPLDPTLDEPTCPTSEYILVKGECVCRPECDRGDGVCECCGPQREWSDEANACVCPDGTYDNGSECVSCEDGRVWDGASCVCPDGMYDSDTGCVTCTEPKTYWNDTLKKCTCPIDKVEVNGVCEDKPICTEPKTKYDEVTNTCQCPDDRPLYNETENKCVSVLCKNKNYECSTNEHCDEGEYCDIECYTEYCTKDTSNMGGTCRNANDDLADKPTGTLYYISNRTMKWWSANNFCQALGLKFPSLSDYDCANIGEGKNCNTENVNNLNTAYGSQYGWTSSEYDACNAYYIDFSSGTMNIDAFYGHYAPQLKTVTVCEKPDCPEETPLWNGTECTACPTTAPYWDKTEEVCKCPDSSTWDEDWNACTFQIKLASYAACDNDCGASQVVQKFSVSNLEASYEAYYTGYADDWYWVCESTLSGLTASECRLKKASINLVAGGTRTKMYVGIAYAGSGATKGYWQSYQGKMNISGTMTFVYNPNIKEMNYCPVGFYCPEGLVAQCIGPSTPDKIEQTVCHTCEERFWRSSDGSCFYCENTSAQTKIDQSECNRCENRFWKSNNYCYHCSTGTQSGITKEECTRCVNRYWIETNATTHIGSCYACLSGMTRDETTGVCKCDDGYFLNLSTKKCVSCTGTTSAISSTELATEKSCPQTRYYANNGSSYLCTATGNYPATTKENCMFCGAKDIRFWKSKNSYCYSCAFTSTVSDTTKAECEQCSNRYWIETNATTHLGSCYACPSGMTRDETTGVCKCDDGYFLNLSTKKCVSCTGTTGGISSTELATEKSCPATRYYANNAKSYLCSATDNPATTKENCMFCGAKDIRFWKSKNGYCYHCSTGTQSGITKEECNTCSDRFWKSNGYCYHCSVGTQSGITKEECIKCSNRYWTVTDAANGLGKCTKCASGTTQNAAGTACE